MKRRIFRRVTQVSVLLLLIAVPLLNKKGITLITGSLYSISLGPLWISDPLSGFQVVLSSLSFDTVLLVSILIPILLAFILGRVFCGWMCPQNTISELFDYISPKLKLKRPFNIGLKARPRYIILAVLLALTPLLGFPVANLISAPGIISVQMSKYILEGTVGLELGLIGLIVLAEVFVVKRVWCNYVCPVGSLLGIFRFKKTMKVVYAEDAEHLCGKCMACADACSLGLDPMGKALYPLCHNCGNCISACEKIRSKEKPLRFGF